MIIPTNESDPLHLLDGDAEVIKFPGADSHPHMALEVGQEVFVPDLVRARRSLAPFTTRLHGI